MMSEDQYWQHEKERRQREEAATKTLPSLQDLESSLEEVLHHVSRLEDFLAEIVSQFGVDARHKVAEFDHMNPL